MRALAFARDRAPRTQRQGARRRCAGRGQGHVFGFITDKPTQPSAVEVEDASLVTDIPDGARIVATGPLTSDASERKKLPPCLGWNRSTSTTRPRPWCSANRWTWPRCSVRAIRPRRRLPQLPHERVRNTTRFTRATDAGDAPLHGFDERPLDKTAKSLKAVIARRDHRRARLDMVWPSAR